AYQANRSVPCACAKCEQSLLRAKNVGVTQQRGAYLAFPTFRLGLANSAAILELLFPIFRPSESFRTAVHLTPTVAVGVFGSLPKHCSDDRALLVPQPAIGRALLRVFDWWPFDAQSHW